MGWLRDVVGGVVEPVGRYGEARERSKQTEVLADAAVEQSRVDAARDAVDAGRSTWRPKWMHSLRVLLAFYFGLSMAGAAVTFGLILLVYFEYVNYSQWAAIYDELKWFLASWATLGGSLITVSTWSFLGYSPFRSMQEIAAGGGDNSLVTRAVRRIMPGTQSALQGGEPARAPAQRLPTGEQPSAWQTERGVAPDEATAPPDVPWRTEAAGRQAARPVTPVPGSQPWQWSARSEQRLSHAHPDLQRLFDWLLPRSPYDLTITETARSVEQQRKNLAKGVSKTMDSRHLERPAMAVDFAILIGNRANWDIEKYREVTDIIKQGADALGIPVTCGIDFKNFTDGPHVELRRDIYPRQPSVLDAAPDVSLA